MISQEVITRVKETMDIIDVVGDFVTLKRKGQNWTSPCPFHQEKTPSFVVSPSKGIYKCFGCGRSGDAIQFVMEMEGFNYGEVIRYLAKKYGIEIKEESTPEQNQHQQEKESLYIILNFAKNYFQNLLWNNDEGKSIGLSYFKERGLSESTIKKFELGYSLDQWDAFLHHAIEKGYQSELVEKTDLVIQKENKKFDRFRGRIMFPIHQSNGRVVGFGARTLKNDKNQAKYINSAESELYHKSKILYGLFQARQSIRQHDLCYLVEGYMDVLMLNQGGIENVVASSGTSLTIEQIKLIGRYTQNITILYDGDAAGINASLRGIDLILEEGLNVRVVRFPEGEDPDSYLQKVGSVEFKKYLQTNLLDFITFKTQLFLSEIEKDPIRKAEIVKEIVASIAKVNDVIKRNIYYRQCSQLLQIDESILISEGNKIRLTKGNSNTHIIDKEEPEIQNVDSVSSPSHSTIYSQEKEIVRLLLMYGSQSIGENVLLGFYILSELDDIEFEHDCYNTILKYCREKSKQNQIVDYSFFINHSDEKIKNEVVDMMVEKYELSENWMKKFSIHIPNEKNILMHAAYLAIIRLKLIKIENLINENTKNIVQADLEKNILELDKQLQIRMELKELEKQLANELGIIISS